MAQMAASDAISSATRDGCAPAACHDHPAAQARQSSCHDEPCVFSGLMSGSRPVPEATR